MIKTTATITELHHSPSGEVVFVLLQPTETFSFLEGQFMMIEGECFGKTVKKPYSIATTNKQLQDYKQLWFYIKKASEDWMSAWLTTTSQVWDSVTLQWPVGHYTDSGDNHQYLLIATWSGLSPNLWLFQHLVYEDKCDGGQDFSRIVHLFWEKDDMQFVPSVMTLLDAHGDDRVTTLTTLSQQTSDKYLSWRVQVHIDAALDQFEDMNISVFLCGAPAMVKEVEQILQEKWIDKANITTEKR